jgi:hypothetical protein
MPTVDLTPGARQALIAMLVADEETMTDPKLHERFSLKIGTKRQDLSNAGFISIAPKKVGNAFVYSLTAKGRARALAALAEPAPPGAKGAMADVRLLYAISNILHRVIEEHGLDDGKVFKSVGTDLPEPKPSPTLEEQVLAAYHGLSKRHGDLVSLVRLRDQLADIKPETLDRTLKAMDRQRVIQLEPDPNRKALTIEARDAAVKIGGEDKHFITIGHR